MTRIIVVEDDLDQQEELVTFLIHAGHEVRGADSGSALEQALLELLPQIVLLDYNLPDATGAELTTLLRDRLGTAVGIVLVTARSMSADRIECRRAGADDYLVKPIDFGELLILIDNLQQRLPSSSQNETWRLLTMRSELLPPRLPRVELTYSEVLLLTAIAQADLQLASRETLAQALGKNHAYYDQRALETRMSRLRHKLPTAQDGRSPLEAVRGIGYQFICPLVVEP